MEFADRCLTQSLKVTPFSVFLQIRQQWFKDRRHAREFRENVIKFLFYSGPYIFFGRLPFLIAQVKNVIAARNPSVVILYRSSPMFEPKRGSFVDEFLDDLKSFG